MGNGLYKQQIVGNDLYKQQIVGNDLYKQQIMVLDQNTKLACLHEPGKKVINCYYKFCQGKAKICKKCKGRIWSSHQERDIPQINTICAYCIWSNQ